MLKHRLGIAVALMIGVAVVAQSRGDESAPRVRVRVLEMDGKPAGSEDAVRFGMVGGKTAEVGGDEFGPWVEVTLNEPVGGVRRAMSKIGPSASRSPQRVRLSVECANDAAGEVSRSEADLHGAGTLCIVQWKDSSGTFQLDTSAGHARRVYGPVMQEAAIPPQHRPKKFLLGERFIPPDDDLIAYREGLARLAAMGFNVIHDVPPAMVDDARKLGFTRVWGAVYNPPGYAFNFAPDRHEVFIKFVNDQIAPPLKAGWTKEQIGMWFTSDEPGWYYPSTYEEFHKDPRAMAAFHAYLKELKFSPEDFGKTSWDEVKLIGRRQYDDLPSRRLFYWSNRFVPWASSTFFAEVARAYEEVIGPEVPVIVNFNNFLGTFYQPGPVGNNSARTDPNAAMGQHDWLEFGRLRGITCISTEDWFGDESAHHWSFHAARLRSAAEMSGVQFGGLVIPRVGGQQPMGMAKKILALLGHGGKVIKFFTFGPEYTFPGNCWSENFKVYKPLGEAMRLVGGAEELMYPGQPRRPQVAILTPQSSQLWDAEDQDIVTGLIDVTNTSMYSQRMHYLSETFSLYVALMHSAIPVRFVDEQMLADVKPLSDCRVLYVTAPDLPEESAEGLLKWVNEGGTLVTVAGTGLFDRYHQSNEMLSRQAGIRPREALRPRVERAGAAVEIRGDQLVLPGFGPVEQLELDGAQIIAPFPDGAPAITQKQVGKGRIVRFALFPGFSYTREFSDAWRTMICKPVDEAAVQRPATVDVARIEAPVLYSDAGAAVTLLNWSGQPHEITLKISLDKPARQAESVRHGKLNFEMERGGSHVSVRLHLDEVDVLLVRY